MATARTTAHLTRTRHPGPETFATAARVYADPDLFFPVGLGTLVEARLAAARRIRAGCQVRTECLAEALPFDHSDGVWGGLDPAELNALRAGTASGSGAHQPCPRPAGRTAFGPGSGRLRARRQRSAQSARKLGAIK
jgi:WhiB family transcriptional regulator, redox-sensing transcriptional regulator